MSNTVMCPLLQIIGMEEGHGLSPFLNFRKRDVPRVAVEYFYIKSYIHKC